MASKNKVLFKRPNLSQITKLKDVLVYFCDDSIRNDKFDNMLNKITEGSIERIKNNPKFLKLKEGCFVEFQLPFPLKLDSLIIVKKPNNPNKLSTQEIGAHLSKHIDQRNVSIFSEDENFLINVIFGFEIRSYHFDKYKSEKKTTSRKIQIFCNNPTKLNLKYQDLSVVNQGMIFARDLTNEPSNILTTIEFSNRLKKLEKIGLKVKILDENELIKLGMNALLGVGQGSPSPSKVVIMEWNGGGRSKPLALAGKGVVFDTGGISIKPANGMEEMTVDMAGAGVVAGVMKTLALRKAKANVISIVGLVENMPDGEAQRPGDVVKSMKGETIEVINTDAEGRLVLCDILWYLQKNYNPKAIIDLATLTGAIIVALGHEKAGVFSNDNNFARQFIESASEEGEGAWQMPLDKSYDGMLKSNYADIKNIGGRAANSILAAKFLQHFVSDEIPWIHLDIAGVASSSSGTKLTTKGATGWGVRSINAFISKYYE